MDVAEGSTPRSLLAELSARTPGLAAMEASLRCAIEQEYAGWDDPIPAGAEVAFIPPTAGG
ncbi:MAG: ThiS family [Chloroflexota bacterium]|jgi:molybdopterin converting factor small subunit|nr:ThiS family [Chloroflexota bacterium]